MDTWVVENKSFFEQVPVDDFPVHSQRAGRLITVAPTSGTLPLRRMVVPRSLIYWQGGVKGCGAAKPIASCSRILPVYAATSGGLITGTRFAARGGSNLRGLGAVK